MSKESVLSDKEKESFQIEKIIFHIIIQEELQPIYLDELELSPEQINFFKLRFKEIAEGVQYIFIDKEKSEVFADCKSIVDDPESNFLKTSKKITASFKQWHNKNTNDGVFITSLVSVDETRKLVFLLKLDHRKVYQYKVSRNKALLEEIKNTFVEDRKAIQKVALIDVSDYYKWDVLAKDKTSTIRDYFTNFLSVTERETPSTLTDNAIKFVNRWALSNHELLDPSQESSSYKSRAITYLMNSNMFVTEDFIEMVIMDSDKNRRESLKSSLKEYLDEAGLSGQSFPPNKGSLTKAKKKHIRQTYL